VNTKELPNYRIYDRTGGGVTCDIYADSLEDAAEQGRDWIEDGDWTGENDNESEGFAMCRTIKLKCEVGPILYRSEEPNIIKACIDWDYEPVGEHVIWTPPTDVRLEIDEDATDNADKHDCSGEYSDPEPECPVEEGWNFINTNTAGFDEFGCLGHGGTAITHYEVCRNTGVYRDTYRPGVQRNSNEPLEIVTYRERDEKSEAWIKEKHSDNGYLPEWMTEMLNIEGDGFTKEEMEQSFLDFATDEAQNVSHGIYQEAIEAAESVVNGDLSRDEAEDLLVELKDRLQEAIVLY
jgi:hypothetical protein